MSWGKAKRILRWFALGAYVGAATLILVESAIGGDGSSEQSNSVAQQVQDVLDKNYDRNALKEIRDFDVNFSLKDGQTIHPDDALTYSLSFSPEDTTYKTLNWDISDPSIIELDASASQIRFLKEGAATVKVSSNRNPNLSKTYSFECKNLMVNKICLNGLPDSLNVGDSVSLSQFVSILPENATDKSLNFVSNSDVLSVDSNGLVRALAPGKGTIKVSSVSNPEVFVNADIDIKKLNESIIEITSFEIDETTDSLNENRTSVVLNGRYYPENASFDPDKVKLDDILTNSGLEYETKRKGKGKFEIIISLPESCPVEGKTISCSAYYGFIASKSQIKINLAATKSITSGDVKGISLDYAPTSFDFEALSMGSYKYYSPLEVSVNFAKSFDALSYKQNNSLFEIKQNNGGVYSLNDFFDLDYSYDHAVFTPIGGLPPSGTIFYYPNKNDKSLYFTCGFSYSLIVDAETTDLDFSIPKLDVSAPNSILINSVYADLLKPEVEYRENSLALNAAIEISTVSNDVALSLSNKYSLKANKECSSKISAKCIITGEEKEYSINSVSTLNQISIFDGETSYDFDDNNIPTIEVSKGEDKSFDFSFSYSSLEYEMELQNAYVQLEIEDSLSSYLYTFKNSSTIRVLSETNNLVPLKINVVWNGAVVKELKANIKISYVAVNADSLTFDIKISGGVNEFNPVKNDFSKIPIGATFNVCASMNEDATSKNLVYSSSDSDVISIDSISGAGKANNAGKSTIKITSVDDSSIFYERVVSVVDTVSPFELDLDAMNLKDSSFTAGVDGELDCYEITLSYGVSYQIKTKTKELSTCSSFSYLKDSTSESNSISIDSSGSISTSSVGKCTYIVTYGDDFTLSNYSIKIIFKVKRNFAFTFDQLCHFVRKAFGHFGLFAMTSLIGAAFILLCFNKHLTRLYGTLGSLITGFALAGFSELIQLFTNGRACQWSDVGIDFAGYVTTIGIVAIIYSIVFLIKFLKEKNKNRRNSSSCSAKKEDN